jgi:hypothetical protein
MEVISSALSAKGRKVFDFEVAGLFEIVVIGNDVRVFLGLGIARKKKRKERKRENDEKRAKRRNGHDFSLQMICNRNETNLVRYQMQVIYN